MRKFPIACARYLGETTFKYRWFALAYVIFAFFLIPLIIFALSIAGWQVLTGIGVPVLFFIITIIIINILQRKAPEKLPEKLRTWEFLPLYLRSLEPIDRVFKNLNKKMKQTCCKRLAGEEDHKSQGVNNPLTESNTTTPV